MIIGIGSDLCRIDRIEKTLARFGERFEARIFTDIERARANGRPKLKADTYAKRFAAKEACSKALGTGFRQGVAWRDMGVINLPSGRPTLQLRGAALERLQQLTPIGYEADIHLSLTDDHPYAMAFVVIGLKPLPHSTHARHTERSDT